MSQTHERVAFRLIRCPDCGFNLCWVNPRFPNYCPECGGHIYPRVKQFVLNVDEEAVLTLNLEALLPIGGPHGA